VSNERRRPRPLWPPAGRPPAGRPPAGRPARRTRRANQPSAAAVACWPPQECGRVLGAPAAPGRSGRTRTRRHDRLLFAPARGLPIQPSSRRRHGHAPQHPAVPKTRSQKRETSHEHLARTAAANGRDVSRGAKGARPGARRPWIPQQERQGRCRPRRARHRRASRAAPGALAARRVRACRGSQRLPPPRLIHRALTRGAAEAAGKCGQVRCGQHRRRGAGSGDWAEEGVGRWLLG
jgi:hypothetical protein